MKDLIRILLFSSIFSVLSFCSFAQKGSDCKFEVETIDAKGGTVKKIKTKLSGSDVFYIIIERKDTAYKITMNFWISGAYGTSIKKNETGVFNVSGGQILMLKNLVDAKAVPHLSDQAWTEYSPEFDIRSQDVKKWRTAYPLSFSIKVNDENFVRQFNAKDIEKIRDIIKCITN